MSRLRLFSYDLLIPLCPKEEKLATELYGPITKPIYEIGGAAAWVCVCKLKCMISIKAVVSGAQGGYCKCGHAWILKNLDTKKERAIRSFAEGHGLTLDRQLSVNYVELQPRD